MYLVGHAIVAFLIAYGISKKFKIGGISFALVMLVATLPDIDILFQSIGIVPHKSYTHSLILSVIVVPSVIFAIARYKRVSSAAAFVYSLAYIQHIIIGDVVVGSTNILYPFGDMMIGTAIGYGTLPHQILEFILLAVAAAIVVGKSFKRQVAADILFRFARADKASYALFIGALVMSFTYLLYAVKVLPRLFIETDLELAVFVLLHISAIALVSFLMIASRQHTVFHSRHTTVSQNE